MANDRQGLEARCQRLTSLVPDRIVVEATGGLERPLTLSLQAAGLLVAVVNPRQACDFGRALGQLAKIDRMDARRLAAMAALMRPPVRLLPGADRQALRARGTAAADRHVFPGAEPSGQCGSLSARPHPGQSGLAAGGLGKPEPGNPGLTADSSDLVRLVRAAAQRAERRACCGRGAGTSQ